MSLTAKHLASVVSTGKGRGVSNRSRCKTASASGATGNTQYVRKHILDLAPYTPIVPFEVLSGKDPAHRSSRFAFLLFSLAHGVDPTLSDVVLLGPFPPTPPSVVAEQLGRAPEDIVKLDANENPYGPPPGIFFIAFSIHAVSQSNRPRSLETDRACARFFHAEVAEALASLRFPHIYPDPESRGLRKALVRTPPPAHPPQPLSFHFHFVVLSEICTSLTCSI